MLLDEHTLLQILQPWHDHSAYIASCWVNIALKLGVHGMTVGKQLNTAVNNG